MREINKIAEALFEKVRDRFEDVSLGDEKAKATSNPEDARFFNFDYVMDGQNYGNITLSLIDEISLKVYFSKNISQRIDGEQRQKWYAFLRELREFAKRNLLSFEPRDITRHTLKHRDIQQVSKADSTYTKDEVVSEGRMYGTTRSSYENDGNVRIIVRHSDYIDPERRGDRSRKIRAIYLENSEGERLKLPMNNLRYARAMARHVSEGGSMHDEFGSHITEIAEACSKLRPFKNSMRRRTFEDGETQTMVEAAFEYHALLNNTLKRMSGRKGYNSCKEAWTANESLLADDIDLDALRERFVKRVYNDQMDQALPLVQKAYEMKKQNKFAQQFESWANEVVGEALSDPNYDDVLELLSDELNVGVDAINATANLESTLLADNENYEELVNSLMQLAEQDPNADARDIIMDWMAQHMPRELEEILAATNNEADNDQELNEDWDEDNVEMIATAIIRRILGNVSQHSELIMKAGPDGVMNAARDVASFHAPVEELGSSDISIMVREVYNEVGVPYPQDPIYEGKTKELSQDLEELTPRQFKAKYKQSKEEMRAKLTEDTKKVARYYLVGMLGDNLTGHTSSPYFNSHEEAVAYKKKFKHSSAVRDADIVKGISNAYGRITPVELLEPGSYDDTTTIEAPPRSKYADDMWEGQGDDYVNRDEKLKRAGAKELSMMDKLKTIPQGMKAFAKGEPEDDVSLYNKSRASLEEMR